jgi:hypothetical protein
MKQRCNNPNFIEYFRYGERGVKVCKRWNTYANFLADMGRAPSPKHSIDRIDNDGDYWPKNCRWATASEQSKNRKPFHRARGKDGRFISRMDWMN